MSLIPTTVPSGYNSSTFDGSTRGAFNATTGALLVDTYAGGFTYGNMSNGNANNACASISCKMVNICCNVAFTYGQNHGNATMVGLANTTYSIPCTNANQIWIDTIASGGLVSYLAFN